jgi:RNA polymerase primary sigma factor
MKAGQPIPEVALSGNLDGSGSDLLTPQDERALLEELDECRRRLVGASAGLRSSDVPLADDHPPTPIRPASGDHPQDGSDPPTFGALRRRYFELRAKLTLNSMMLVAHAAKRFRDRGISYHDLIQEGFCGLLEAIDHFDVSNQNKLATYAMWWIRQRMQRAVAAGAYPVRLNPSCLRKMAEDLHRRERTTRDVERVPETAVEPIPKAILHLWAVTRPAVWLDEDRHGKSPIIQAIVDPHGDATAEVETRESLEKLLGFLLPREKQVLYLRFGLEGQAQHTLSQAGKLLGVSKERIRQIQDRALEKLRAMV